MLILTRNMNQSIVIGEDMFISVLGVKGNQVRLGIHRLIGLSATAI